MEAIRLKTRVEAGGEVRLPRLELPAGEEVEVIVLCGTVDEPAGGPGGDIAGLSTFFGRGRGLGFASVDEADRSLREERDAWKR